MSSHRFKPSSVRSGSRSSTLFSPELALQCSFPWPLKFPSRVVYNPAVPGQSRVSERTHPPAHTSSALAPLLRPVPATLCHPLMITIHQKRRRPCLEMKMDRISVEVRRTLHCGRNPRLHRRPLPWARHLTHLHRCWLQGRRSGLIGVKGSVVFAADGYVAPCLCVCGVRVRNQ